MGTDMTSQNQTDSDHPTCALRTQDICRELSCARSTLYQMIAAGEFPAADLTIGISGKRWTRKLFDSWLAERTGARGPGRPRAGSK